MLKKVLLYSLVIAFAGIHLRCASDCGRVDCGNPVLPIFSFRLLNAAGKDLLTGPAKQFDTSAFKILAKRVDNAAIETIRRSITVVSDTNYLSAFAASKSYAVYYISLNNTITDSLVFTFNQRETDCCDNSFYSLSKINTAALTPPLSLPYNNYPIVK